MHQPGAFMAGPRLCTIALALACLSFIASTLVPSSADARRKNNEKPIAIWQLMTPDEDRALAEHWFGEIAEGVHAVDGLIPDSERRFSPSLKPAEGVVVAIETSQRWLDAAWLAHSRREWTTALGLADDALALVEHFPAGRLPEGLRRDLMLLRARALTRSGAPQDGRDALRSAMLLDPSWEAHPRWEHGDVVEQYESIAQERAGVPPALVTVHSDVSGARILVSGIGRADTRDGPITLELPPGAYEIAARKAGYTAPYESITVRPREEVDVDLNPEIRNTAAFQELLEASLDDPTSARRSDVWEGLRLASSSVEAQGVLTARFEREPGTDGGRLQIGLYLPGRAGWAFYREVELKREGRDAFRVQAVIDALTLALDRKFNPATAEELAAR
jgi:hypothetical protein